MTQVIVTRSLAFTYTNSAELGTTVIQLIGNTTTEAGLQVRAALDKRKYPTHKKVSDELLAEVHLTAATFHGDWNYTVAPD